MRFGQTMTYGMAVLALAVGATGCSDDETGPTGHTSPVAARLVVNDIEVNDGETLTLTAGQMVTVNVQLLDEHGAVIDGIESSHYVKLNFTPAELATSVDSDIADAHFEKNVTAQATAGTGTLSIGYGHDADADEKSFGTFNVEVTASPCACQRRGVPELVGVAHSPSQHRASLLRSVARAV